MEKHKLHPLTNDQKAFCEENHNLVYAYLHKHKYSIEEFYNVVILNYVRACQSFLEREDLRNSMPFSIVAHMAMKQAISNHFVTENRQCRKAEYGTISLEQMKQCAVDGKAANEIPSNAAGILDTLIQSESDKQFVETVLSSLSDTQRGIVVALLHGYKEMEIYQQLAIGRKTYKAELEGIKAVLRKIS